MAGQERSLLIVDDEQLILFGLKKALRHHPYQVVTAETAAQALEVMAERSFDMCILDIHLPDFNGLELMKAIKLLYPETLTVIMTASYINGSNLSSNIRQAILGGACHFIIKPFKLNEVTTFICEALDQNSCLFSQGCRFIGNDGVKSRRQTPRRPFARRINLSMNTNFAGKQRRSTFTSQSIDMSEGGIGLTTLYPLEPGQPVNFENTFADRTGVVVWKTIFDAGVCRAGIRFSP
ncbi:MAG: response regulator [Deltaproteobacteria bacterium]|nr:response regulator [Candidatus Anaeroferrophillus wilburensis]MBN2887995.1 response regulator [Deltaproteobacteria bacterium]